MDTSSPIDAKAMRHGLRQLLQCYSASGLKRFNVQASGELSPEVVAQLASASQVVTPVAAASAPMAPTARVPVERSSQPTVESSIEQPAKASSASPSTGSELLLPMGSWQLPNLDDDTRQDKLQELDVQVKACRKCADLVCYRRQTVFGEGHLRPKVCFFGEAPGADEDAQGRPFVGAAGRLLTDIIRAMKLTREEVYILNSLKCRPPQNRTPSPEEVDNCRPYALTQLELLQPEFIILLGAVAVRSVLQSTDSVGRLRGRFHQFHGARVLVTYHPAYLLRTPDAKKLVWQDVQMVMRELGLS